MNDMTIVQSLAAQRLSTIASECPSLSAANLLEDPVQKMRNKLSQLETRYIK
jgi:hypothetical protein